EGLKEFFLTLRQHDISGGHQRPLRLSESGPRMAYYAIRARSPQPKYWRVHLATAAPDCRPDRSSDCRIIDPMQARRTAGWYHLGPTYHQCIGDTDGSPDSKRPAARRS